MLDAVTKLSPENVTSILFVRGFSYEDAVKFVKAGYALAVKRNPEADSVDIAIDIATLIRGYI